MYLSLCAVSNHIRRFKRPEYIAHRDFTPIDCLGDDCLLRNDPVDLPWQHGPAGQRAADFAGRDHGAGMNAPGRSPTFIPQRAARRAIQ